MRHNLLNMEAAVWLLEGLLLGTAIFVIGFALYLVAHIWRMVAFSPTPSAGQGQIGWDVVTLIRRTFLHSPGFYAAFIGCLLIGCAIVGFWLSREVPFP